MLSTFQKGKKKVEFYFTSTFLLSTFLLSRTPGSKQSLAVGNSEAPQEGVLDLQIITLEYEAIAQRLVSDPYSGEDLSTH